MCLHWMSTPGRCAEVRHIMLPAGNVLDLSVMGAASGYVAVIVT